jgi:hypothetical protein
MAGYETTEEDSVLSRDATAAGDGAAAMSTPAVAESFVHSRLLDSVASFTHHRDIAALDHSLVLSLAELTSAHSVVLAKRALDGAYVESIVRCVPDAQGAYQLQADDPDRVDPALKLLHRCMHRLEMQTERVRACTGWSCRSCATVARSVHCSWTATCRRPPVGRSPTGSPASMPTTPACSMKASATS